MPITGAYCRLESERIFFIKLKIIAFIALIFSFKTEYCASLMNERSLVNNRQYSSSFAEPKEISRK
jgi:hypothetical protein